MDQKKFTRFHSDMDRFIDEFDSKPIKLTDGGIAVSFEKKKYLSLQEHSYTNFDLVDQNSKKPINHQILPVNAIFTKWLAVFFTWFLDLFVVFLTVFIVYVLVRVINTPNLELAFADLNQLSYPVHLMDGFLKVLIGGWLGLFGVYILLFRFFRVSTVGRMLVNGVGFFIRELATTNTRK